MKKIKEKLLENDFGAYLYDLRQKKGYTIEELAEKINMPTVKIKTIKKWEHDLEFPDLDQIYKLSEIYEVESTEIMQVKTQTLQEGLEGVPKTLIRFIGYILGISIYGTLILTYGAIAFFGIWSLFRFAEAANNMAEVLKDYDMFNRAK